MKISRGGAVSSYRTMITNDREDVKEAVNILEKKVEQTGENLTHQWIATVDELATLPENWDGEGARAVPQEIAANTKQIIEATRAHIAYLDDIYPTDLGTLCMQWKKTGTTDRINAEIGKERMAFYTHISGIEFRGKKPSKIDETLIADLSSHLSLLQS